MLASPRLLSRGLETKQETSLAQGVVASKRDGFDIKSAEFLSV
jgi:hypothetical protein